MNAEKAKKIVDGFRICKDLVHRWHYRSMEEEV